MELFNWPRQDCYRKWHAFLAKGILIRSGTFRVNADFPAARNKFTPEPHAGTCFFRGAYDNEFVKPVLNQRCGKVIKVKG